MNKSVQVVILAIFFQFIFSGLYSQELYVFSEPASNMPAKSLGLKYSRKSVKETELGHSHTSSRHMFETQFGISKKLMIHPSVSWSDMYSYEKMRFESAGLYVKYRFLSVDAIHKHFRASLFAKGVVSRNDLQYEELTVDGDHTAIQGGIIMTQLIHKLAISTTLGITEIMDKERWLKYGGPRNFVYENFNYSLSAGYLLFPRKYTGFDQPNFNLYCELLGSKGLSKNVYFLDLAPALQVILKSTTKLNFGYRFELAGNTSRMAPAGFLISVEKTFLNALKKKN